MLIDEEKDKIKMAMSVCEEALVIKKRLEYNIRRAEVSEKERDRDLSSKRAKLKKQMNTAIICASIDLSKVADKSFDNCMSTPSRNRFASSAKKQRPTLSPGKANEGISIELKNSGNFTSKGMKTVNL